MRDIKFRAWFSADRHKKMVYNLGFDHDSFKKLTDENADLPCVWDKDVIDSETGSYDATLNFEIMQFTGLTDKNGKDIYEGDICRDEDGIGVIYWDKDCWMYGFVFDGGDYQSDGYMLREMERWCEIIGNIHQNPELLEVPHDTKI